MGKRKKPNGERNNYQDQAEVREYDKGVKAGEQQRGNKWKGGQSKKNKPKPKFSENDMINNVSWYTPNNILLKDVASFPFGRITGYPIVEERFANAGSAVRNEFISVPGVMSLQVLPTFGPTASELSTSPLNLASQSLFSFTRHENSGRTNYESNDEMLYVLAVSNVIAYYSYLVRAYGVMSNYSVMNKYTPQALITAMGINFYDLQSNYTNLRAAINLLAYRLQTLVIPKGIDYVDRQVFLFENVYTDADNAKAQYYMFNPIGFYQYIEGSATTNGGYLQFKPLVKSGPTTNLDKLLTVQELIAYGNDLLDPILGSTDFNEIIAGDILKAFGAGNTYTVPSISETYQVVPQYNKEILSQIENAIVYDGSVATIVDDEYEQYLPTLKQNTQINSSTLVPQLLLPLFPAYDPDSSTVHTNWKRTAEQRMEFNDYMLNMHETSVSPEMVMVASRLVSGDVAFAQNISINSTSIDLYTVSNCGTEIVFNGAVFYYNQSANVANPPLPQLTVESISRAEFTFEEFGGNSGAPTVAVNAPMTNLQNYFQLIQKLTTMAKFDWAPRMSAVMGYAMSNGYEYWQSDITWDLDNFTLLSLEQVQNLHNIAITGLFTCKTMGSYTPK